MRTKRNVTWPQASYEWAMSLRGTLTARAAEAETGIPKGTIYAWWRGSRPRHGGVPGRRPPEPRTHCKRGHRFTPENTYDNRTIGRRQCLTCKRLKDRAYHYRRRGVYHPEWNPDEAVAPLHHLWLPGAQLAAFILERYSRSEVYQQLGKGSAALKRFEQVTNGREWLRFDTADRLFVALGLVLSELDLDPLYSTTPPKEAPVGAE